MKAQIENILNRKFESEADFDKTLIEVRKLAEASPQEWQADLNAAADKANEAQAQAERDYQDAAQNETAAEERSAELKPAEVNEYKARAWDSYWTRHTWRVIRDALYEEAQNVNFIMGATGTPLAPDIFFNEDTWEPATTPHPADNAAPEPQEAQASNLSLLCDYIRPYVANDDALLSALIEQLSEWRRNRDFDF